eukprot:comp19609_c0_seq1/m.37507 comp19609_c0_seq1/g.37507  ORF comp19609_c0_seq1/g.37507 comp19609_c0_seq1/m.37507 type:complete len:474 (+) comp19609_c0_seq1:1-1422(+)
MKSKRVAFVLLIALSFAIADPVKSIISRKNLVSLDFDLDDAKYLKSLGVLLLPGIVIGLLGLVLGALFVVMRYCTKGACGGKDPKKGGYTRRERLTLFILFSLFLTLFLLGTIIGIANSVRTTKAYKDFFSNVERGVTRQQSEIGIVYDQLSSTDTIGDQSLLKTYNADAMRGTAAEYVTHFGKAKAKANGFDQIRTLLTLVGLILTLFAGAVGLLSAMLRKGRFSAVMMIMSIISGLIVWVAVGLTLPQGAANAGFCKAIQTFNPRPFTDVSTPLSGKGVAYVATCLPGAETKDWTTIVATSLNDDNTRFHDNNERAGLILPSIIFNASDPFAGYNQATKRFDDMDRVVNVIKGSQSQLPSSQLTLFVRIQSQIEVLLRVRDIAYCKIVVESYAQVYVTFCKNALESNDLLLAVLISFGILLLPATVCAIKGMKRFKKLRRDLQLNADVHTDKARYALRDAEDEDAMENRRK